MSCTVIQKEMVAHPSFENPAEDDDDELSDESPTLSRQEITKPGEHDVLLGRGGGTNNHTGNIKFRKVVNEHKMRYLACSKVDKPKVAREVVQLWRKMSPPGRFLSRGDESKKGPGSVSDAENKWYEVGDKKAREKASQCLRERTPDVLPYIKHLRQQQDQLTEQGVTMVQHQLQMQQANTSSDISDFCPPGGGMQQVSSYQAGRNSIVNMPDCPQSSSIYAHQHHNRRGSLPAAPTSMSMSAPFPPHQHHSRRISMPAGGGGQHNNMNNTANTNSMQMQQNMNMNMMVQQQQRQQQVLQDAYTVVERASMYPGSGGGGNNSSINNMSPCHAMTTERELMMQQQYGVYDMPNMNMNMMLPAAQGGQQIMMVGTQQQQQQQPMPNPAHSHQGRFVVSPPTPRQRSMPNIQERPQHQSPPQHYMQQSQSLHQQQQGQGQGHLHHQQHNNLVRHQSLPAMDDLEPLPYDEGEQDNDPADALPDIPHSAPMTIISPNVPQKAEKQPGDQEQQRQITPNRPQDQPPQRHSPQPEPEDDVFQPLPLGRRGQGQRLQTPPNKETNKAEEEEKKSSAEDSELTLREYRKTLEEYITNHQIATPNIDVLDDEYSDDEDLGLIGVDASEWIQNALNDSGNDMDGAGKSPNIRRRGSHTLSVKSGAMSTATSYMSLALSDMEESGDGLSKDLKDEFCMRADKMRMARNMSSNQSLMSELTDFDLEC